MDTSAIRLVNDTKVYLHAVIDNLCRRILAWCVVDKFEIASMVSPLRDAARGAVIVQEMPKLVADAECQGPLRKIERPFKAVFRVLVQCRELADLTHSAVAVQEQDSTVAANGSARPLPAVGSPHMVDRSQAGTSHFGGVKEDSPARKFRPEIRGRMVAHSLVVRRDGLANSDGGLISNVRRFRSETEVRLNKSTLSRDYLPSQLTQVD